MKRVALADRPWLECVFAQTFEPVHAPSPNLVRAALSGLRAYNPAHPLVCRLDLERLLWRPIPDAEWEQHLDSVVENEPFPVTAGGGV
jgi:hypothetical protein